MEPTWPYKYFTREELECKCGCKGIPEWDFISKLDELRDSVGFPLPVTSAYRCPEWNNRVSRSGTTGPHTTGRAVDIAVNRGQAFYLIEQAIDSGFTGIGLQQKGQGRFVHLDDLPNAEGQPRPTVWTY